MTIHVELHAPARVAEGEALETDAEPTAAEKKLTDLRHLHVHFGDVCVLCQEEWPCLVIQVIGEQ